MSKKNKVQVFVVEYDDVQGNWRVVSNGSTRKREATKRAAVQAGVRHARRRANDNEWALGVDTQLRVLDLNDKVVETRSYQRNRG